MDSRQEPRSRIYHEVSRLEIDMADVSDLIRIWTGKRRGLSALTVAETWRVYEKLAGFTSARQVWRCIRRHLAFPAYLEG